MIPRVKGAKFEFPSDIILGVLPVTDVILAAARFIAWRSAVDCRIHGAQHDLAVGLRPNRQIDPRRPFNFQHDDRDVGIGKMRGQSQDDAPVLIPLEGDRSGSVDKPVGSLYFIAQAQKEYFTWRSAVNVEKYLARCLRAYAPSELAWPEGVVLGAVNCLAVEVRPLANLQQPLLHNDGNASIGGRPDV